MAKINAQRNNKDIKIKIEKNEIKNQLGNTIKSNLNTGIKSSVGMKKNVNFVRAVGMSNVKVRRTSENRYNSTPSLLTNALTGGKLKTKIEKYLNKYLSEGSNKNPTKNNKSNLKTIKESYLSRTRENEDSTENTGVSSVGSLKKGISEVDQKVKTVKNGIKTGESITKNTIRTGKVAVKKLKMAKLAKLDIKNISSLTMKSVTQSGKVIKEATKGSSKIIYKNLNENIKSTLLEDKNNDIAIQSMVDSFNNVHTVVEVGKRAVNVGIKINDHYKNRNTEVKINNHYKNKNKEYTKIQTKASSNINTKSEKSIYMKNSNSGVKTKNNKNINANLNKKRANDMQMRKKMKEVAETVAKETEVIVKKISEAAVKSKFAVAISIGLLVTIIVMCLTSILGVVNFAGVIPNIDDADKWKKEMNRMETEANRKINEADQFIVKGSSNADWRDVIAVYMAKYENDPPENFGKNSNNSNSGSITVGSNSETTFTGTYSDIIKIASERYSIDANLIAAIIKQESQFDTNAVSSAGAMGLMQLMPDTATGLGVLNPFDPYQNIMGGAQLLQNLCELYNNDLTLVLIGYNWGQGNIKKYGVTSSNYLSITKVPNETKNYIPIVMANYEAYTNGTKLPDDILTGVVNSSNSKDDNELSKIYYLFNTLVESKIVKTVTHDDGSTSSKTIHVVTLYKHDINYVMEKLTFTDDQKELAKAMLEADAFSEFIPNFDFKFKIRGGSNGRSGSNNSGSGNIQIGTGGSNGTGEAINDAKFAEVTKLYKNV